MDTLHTEPASQMKKRAQDGPDWHRHCARDTDDEQVSDQEELTTDRWTCQNLMLWLAGNAKTSGQLWCPTLSVPSDQYNISSASE